MNKIIAIGLLISYNMIFGVTLVYNLRVRRIFHVPPVLKQIKDRWPVTAVPIFFSRKRHIIDERTNLDTFEKRRAGGSLVNIRYVPSKHWWAEVTTGFETDHGTFTGTDTFHASRAGLDDIVLTAGYRHFLGEHGQIIVYGLAGFPTRRKITKCDRHGPLLGTRLYNLGVGGELSYSIVKKLKRSFAIIFQPRIIHGFDRDWFPILPKGSKIQPGNATDLLFTLQYREKFNIIETGYNATFFTNQALLLPTQKIKADTIIRHGGFITYKRVWFDGLFGKPLILGAGFNINDSKTFDTRTYTGWVFGTVIF